MRAIRRSVLRAIIRRRHPSINTHHFTLAFRKAWKALREKARMVRAGK